MRIEFDPDWDHPMETVLMTHPEEVVPFMVKDFDVSSGDRLWGVTWIRNPGFHHELIFKSGWEEGNKPQKKPERHAPAFVVE